MAKITITFLILVMFFTFNANDIFSMYTPSKEGYVTDTAKVVGQEQRLKIKRFAERLKSKTGVSFAVLTITTLKGEDINKFTDNVFKQWKLSKPDEDNGILLVLSAKENIAKIKAGKDLNLILSEEIIQSILLKMDAFLQTEWFEKAVYFGSIYIINQVAKEYNIDISEFPDLKKIRPKPKWTKTFPKKAITFIISLIIIYILYRQIKLVSYLREKQGYWSKGFRGGFCHSGAWRFGNSVKGMAIRHKNPWD